MTTASAALRARLNLTDPALRAATTALWAVEGLRERYLDYLEVMHGVIRASVPLMRAAIHRCTQRGDDPLALDLARYLIEHAAEESRHDEWLLEDIAAGGRDPAAVLTAQPGPAIARLAGPEYYWIEHHHPVALLGYIAVLEGNQPPRWLGTHLAAATGLPAAAFRTLELHADLDLGHRDELDALLDRLPLGPADVRAIAVSALHTVDAFTHLLEYVTTRRRPDRSEPDE